MKNLAYTLFPEWEKTLNVKVRLLTNEQSTFPINPELQNLTYTPFFLIDYLRRNAVKEFSLVSYKNGLYPVNGFFDVSVSQISMEKMKRYRNDLDEHSVCSSWFSLGDWLYTDEVFQLLCDNLKNSKNVEKIAFIYFDPSSENISRLISAIQANPNPNIKISLLECGMLFTQAMERLNMERLGTVNIANSNELSKITSSNLSSQQPFAIEHIDPRIIYGFVAAIGLSAIVCTFVVLPATLLNPVTVTVATVGAAALALGSCGLFSSAKLREPKDEVLSSTSLNRVHSVNLD